MAAFPPPAPSVDAVGAALDRLQHLHPKAIDLSLDRMWRLLATLGHPERALPPVIHVAGTNGKGSTIAFLRAACEAAGLRVHAYTSPHLVRFNERIRLAGSLIGDDHLADVLERCERHNGAAPITYFEVTTAAAMLAFAEVPADVLLMEVGLGGRLDATNVVERPAACVITRISRDHIQFLGEDVAGIAREKAGIARAAVPLVVGPQPDPAVALAIDACIRETGARPYRCGVEWRYAAEADGWRLSAPDGAIDYPLPSLDGAHQVANAATAMATLDVAGLPVDRDARRLGLRTVYWPARLQRLHNGRLITLLPAGSELWLDGGHNDSAGTALADWLGSIDARPTHLVIGMMGQKDHSAFLAPMAAHVRGVVTVPVPGEENAATPEDLRAAASAAGYGYAETASDVPSALALLADRAAQAPEPARILICGSLYLAGAVLAADGA